MEGPKSNVQCPMSVLFRVAPSSEANFGSRPATLDFGLWTLDNSSYSIEKYLASGWCTMIAEVDCSGSN